MPTTPWTGAGTGTNAGASTSAGAGIDTCTAGAGTARNIGAAAAMSIAMAVMASSHHMNVGPEQLTALRTLHRKRTWVNFHSAHTKTECFGRAELKNKRALAGNNRTSHELPEGSVLDCACLCDFDRC